MEAERDTALLLLATALADDIGSTAVFGTCPPSLDHFCAHGCG